MHIKNLMKVLFIGGTGNISSYASKILLENGIDLYILTRGNAKVDLPGANLIKGNIRNKDAAIEILNNQKFDVVVDWIAFKEDHVEFDFELFKEKVKQYIFIAVHLFIKNPRPLHTLQNLHR